MTRSSLVFLGYFTALVSFSAHAVDGISLEGGASFSDERKTTTMARVGVQWDWDLKWFQTGSWYLGGYWDASVGDWHTDDRDGGSHDVGDFSITPVLRFQSAATSGFVPYVEVGVGAHVLTSKNIADDRHFSTNFQFGNHFGAGIRFGDKAQYDLSYRLQHLSNGGIDTPNPGINFNQLRFEYHF
jgi:lipid A 3-O-deacylase